MLASRLNSATYCLLRNTLFAVFFSLMLSGLTWAEPKKIRTGITFEIMPSDVVIYLDGKKLGIAGKVSTVRTRPGRRRIKLTRNGDETQLEVIVKKRSLLKLQYNFEN